MSLRELVDCDMKYNFVKEIESMDLSSCGNADLVTLRNWIIVEKERADFLTREDEIVGYAYHNLDALTPKVEAEEQKRGIQLTKVMRFNNSSSTTTRL